jgi:hypothetical protein
MLLYDGLCTHHIRRIAAKAAIKNLPRPLNKARAINSTLSWGRIAEVNMSHSFWKAVLTVVAAAVTTGLIERAVLPSMAQGEAACGTVASNRACELTGHKLLRNPNAPDLLTLEIETKQGPYSFVASSPAMEQFAKELLQNLEDASAKKL